MSIGRDEWLQALSEAGCHDAIDDKEAMTIAEFSAMMGLPRERAARRLRTLVERGKAIETRKHGARVDGRSASLLAYRLISATTPDAPRPR